MRIFLEGTAGPEGWPSPGCRCASCGRTSARPRRPLSVVVDDVIRLSPGPPHTPSRTGLRPGPDGHVMEHTPDGLAVTGPDGGRLLHAGIRPPADASGPHTGDRAPASHSPTPYDVVLLDPLDRPERLGDLRRRGLATPRTRVVAVGLDHRVPSEAELARRLTFWGMEAVPDGTALETRDLPSSGRSAPRRTLLLGGARSGKSEEAELRLAAEPRVTYVATGPSGDDPSWLARVKAHRDRRPAHWETVETTDLAGLLRVSSGTLLIDGLGTWIAAVFDECGAWPGYEDDSAHERDDAEVPLDRVALRCDELVEAWRRTEARVVAVSDEVGFGVIPATASGRLFRDALGRLNQRLARESEDVALVVAGRVLPLPI
ncbi:bifunctional adenosylcobinamide kinase/adenosylcobinamide-phosphate guanylyltransferase [Microtetraspora niveoalba]|uniref:bifunctional adenosylcobinamide kinase/adenosylcobinamide-phosphate guanylyltransferase n=1 Tax=Microtetraspora niveoalba TaxID=46175 RepID=UPI0009FEFA58|nr:bifunctional adenosylcobinamide kinase/adenosylcobinamide-phosphate guanylyltransferase [Microtetraspora niveoalba]